MDLSLASTGCPLSTTVSRRVRMLIIGRATHWIPLALLACSAAAPRMAAAQSIAGTWAANGVPVETVAANDAILAVPVADGVGGLFVVWQSRTAGASSND